jgi:hypothetical protein
MIDRAVADAAFALKEGEVSAPVQGRFGTVLVQVLKIEPEQVRPFEQVAGELKQELAAARAKSEIFDVYNKIEDARAEGKPLAEAAATLKLEARTVEVDRSGRDPAGTPVKLPDAQRLLAAAFTTDIGVERDPLQFEDGYIWYDVAGISPSRERSLDEVKDQVEARWREQEIAARLDAKATSILDKLKAGTTLSDVAAAEHLKVETLSGLKRGQASGPLSAAGVDTVFRTAKDADGKAEGAQPPAEVVFRVTDIVVPPLDMASEDAKRMVETLNRGLSDAILARIYCAARKRYRRDHQSKRAEPSGQRRSGRRRKLSLAHMQIEPPAPAFAKRYARGEAQVVWTTLVSDLETPVSAFLKIATARPLSFLLESVEGGAVRGRYSIIGLNPDLVWRTVAGRAEINRNARQSADTFTPCAGPPLAALRSLIAESRIDLPDVLPPMAAGIFGYLGYDMVRMMEDLPPPNPDPIGIPEAVLVRPTVVVVFDAVKDVIAVVTPVRPQSGVSADAAFARASERLSAIVDALDAPWRTPRPTFRPARSRCGRPPMSPRPSMSAWSALPRNTSRRRHFSGRVVATVRSAVRIASVCALSGTASGQPGAVSLFPRFRRVFDRRFESGDLGASARRHGDHSAARGHPAARRYPAAGQSARDRAVGGRKRTRRTPDASRPWPQRCRTRRAARHGQGDRSVLHRALQPGDAHRLQCRGPARRKIRRP